MDELKLGRYDSIARSSSVTVVGYPYPEVAKTAGNRKMLVTVDREGDAPEGCTYREVQRVVASHSFHGTEHPVQMFVMIEAGTPGETKSRLHRSERGKYGSCTMREVYVAKAFAILTARRIDEEGESTKKEVALVQYLDLCNEARRD